MEDPPSFSDPEVLSNYCAYLNRVCRLSFDSKEEDPLGSPERTLTINDDWTVTQDRSLPIFQYDSAVEQAEDNDERSSSDEPVRSVDDRLSGDSRAGEDDNEPLLERIYRHFSSRKNPSADSEDQIVPSEPFSAADAGSTDKNDNAKSLDDNEVRKRNDGSVRKTAITTNSGEREEERRVEEELELEKEEEEEEEEEEEIENRNGGSQPP